MITHWAENAAVAKGFAIIVCAVYFGSNPKGRPRDLPVVPPNPRPINDPNPRPPERRPPTYVPFPSYWTRGTPTPKS